MGKSQAGTTYYRHMSRVARFIDKLDKLRALKAEFDRRIATASAQELNRLQARIYELETEDNAEPSSVSMNDTGRLWTF